MSGFEREWAKLTAELFWLIGAAAKLDGDARQRFIEQAEVFIGQAIEALAKYELADFEDEWLRHREDGK